MSDLDTIDISILKILQHEGRISNAALAERVGLSASACSRRLDILEKSGVIKGYHARLSHKALDYRMIAIVHISLSGQFAKTLDRVRGSGEALSQCAGLLPDER
jgi:Lrp/AsnC family leucine-responsive transcriptional regulator